MAISPSDIFGLNRARAAAKSIKFNPRNLEFLWYPFWTRAISRIACEIDSERCTVAPQYPLWRIWTHDDTQLGSIIMLPEGDAMDDLAAEQVCDQNIDDDLFDDQESISTLNETLSVKTRSRITDFAMLYWVERNSVNPDKDDDEDEAFLIEHEFIPALIEVKRSASRKLSEEALLHDQANLMYRAKEAVFRQVIYPQYIILSLTHPLCNRHCIYSPILDGAVRTLSWSLLLWETSGLTPVYLETTIKRETQVLMK